jgi:pathogenesis-related protein 1
MTPRLLRIALLALLTISLVGFVAGRAVADVTPTQQAALLAAHNGLRRNVAAAETQRLGQTVTIPALVWNADLAAVAQAWANTMLATNTDDYNPNAGDVGENIYTESGADPATSGDRAFASWAAEAASYSWDTSTCTDTCTDYLQLVWASTTGVGCGMATDGTTTAWVCDYASPGNLDGERPYEPGAVTPPATGASAAPASPQPTSTPVAPPPGTANGGSGTAPPAIYTVRNQGGFIISFAVTYTVHGMTSTVTTDHFSIGSARDLAIPADATTVMLAVTVVFGIDPPPLQFATAASSCYVMTGTTLSNSIRPC